MCEQVREYNPAILDLKTVFFDGVEYQLTFGDVSFMAGADGEQCATYKINGYEDEFDLGVVYVPEGKTTEWQLTLEGEETREVPVSGDGFFEILRSDGTFERYTIAGGGKVISVRTFTVDSEGRTTKFVEPENFCGFCAKKGDLIRLSAVSEDFVIHEFCIKPPYSENHFMTIPADFKFKAAIDV